MVFPLKLNAVANLPSISASDVDAIGWPGEKEAMGRCGAIVVTDPDGPQAVILPVADYMAATQALRDAQSPLDALRRSYDERLVSLRAPDAGDRLRALINEPTALGGRVVAGEEH